MGWSFKWVSSFNTDFNYDFYASFTPEEMAKASGYWNYRSQKSFDTDVVGISVFYRDANGQIFQLFLLPARLDMMNGAYHHIDPTPKGRDEADGGNCWTALYFTNSGLVTLPILDLYIIHDR